MSQPNDLDCIIVGYKDVDFPRFVKQQKSLADYSGAYAEVRCNSILLDGRRRSYPELLNSTLTKATGQAGRINGFETPSLGAYHLASLLTRHGLRVDIVNFFNHEIERFEELLDHGPRSVAITTTYYVEHSPIVDVVRFIRERAPQTKIIVGGPHVYNICRDHDEKTQRMIFNQIGADVYIFDSQGEGTLSHAVSELKNGGDLDRVPNLIYRDGDDYQRTPRLAEANPMNEISVDWRLFEPTHLTPVTFIRTARSCPFSCSFCNYPTLGGKYEMASVDVIEREMRALHEAGVEYLGIVDDTLNVPLPRFKKICKMMIENRFNFKWFSFFRCSNSDDEAFDLMAEAGCMGTLLGVESGDQRILDNMNKAVKIEKYYNGIKKLKERDILTYTMLIVGYPGETEESIMNTLKFVRESQPDFYNYQLYFHDQQAPIQKRAEEFGIEGSGYSWKHNTMDWRQATEWMEYFYRNVRVEESVILPLYGVSMWTMPYLFGSGITPDQFRRFTTLANRMLLATLDDQPADFSREEKVLQDIFSGFSWPRRDASASRVRESSLAELPLAS